MNIKDKERQIKAETTKLNKLYKDLPENQQKLLKPLIENAAFMKVTLADLQETVNRDGAIVTSTNGNGFQVTSEHPAQKSYNTMINRYQSVIRQLSELLPAEVKKSKLEELMEE